MTKKILILGCSFTAGSYEPCYIENRASWQAPDRIKNYKGWYFYTDYFKNKDVTVIACTGQGYWSYYQILCFLRQENKLNYNEIWIQETLEIPLARAFILEQKNLEYTMLSAKEYNNFILMHFSSKHGLDLQVGPFKLWSDNSFFNDIVKMCSEKIDLLCEERNIKGYVWSMYEPIMDCNHFTRLPLKNIRQELYDNNLLTGKEHKGCHQTEEGNKYIAKNINTVS